MQSHLAAENLTWNFALHSEDTSVQTGSACSLGPMVLKQVESFAKLQWSRLASSEDLTTADRKAPCSHKCPRGRSAAIASVVALVLVAAAGLGSCRGSGGGRKWCLGRIGAGPSSTAHAILARCPVLYVLTFSEETPA